MDKQHRKDLKTDKFAEEVFDIFDWATVHRDKVIRYGGLAVAVILLASGIFAYMRYQSGLRQEALAKATQADDATVGPNPQVGVLNFATQDEKEKSVSKAYSEVVSKYGSSNEGAIARLRLASIAADKGNLAEAEKGYKEVVDNASAEYAALARMSLAQIYSSQGKTADAEKLLRAAVDNPTATVSKEQAAVALAQVLMKSNPAEAKKLLEPLRMSPRVVISQAAVTAYATLPEDLKKEDSKKDDSKK